MKNVWINNFKKNIQISTFFILFIIILLCLILYFMVNQETFDEEEQTQESKDIFKKYLIDFYVITQGQEDRLKNIQKQTDKINDQNPEGKPVYIKQIEAINGENLNLYKLAEMGKIKKTIIDDGIDGFTRPSRRKYEIGCYLSHIKTYNEILSKNDLTRYSIIFEDDFDIKENFIEILNLIMKQITENQIDFDILLLGLIGGGPEEPNKLSENIYKLNNEAINYGAHAYMVPNIKLQKILEKMSYIDKILDVKLFSPSTGLIVLHVDPLIVNQAGMGTTIR